MADDWEFPAELDEFLEFCVEEHAGDFEVISREFLEVASGLDDQLADRAEEAFSAECLRRRYIQLHEAGHGVGGLASAGRVGGAAVAVLGAHRQPPGPGAAHLQHRAAAPALRLRQRRPF
ncbi:unnamed protein product [Effrenium voratum]|nr:unnamed protein product [Effrenium voratum]